VRWRTGRDDIGNLRTAGCGAELADPAVALPTGIRASDASESGPTICRGLSPAVTPLGTVTLI